jgi:predicted O-methyltransferase YrrM
VARAELRRPGSILGVPVRSVNMQLGNGHISDDGVPVIEPVWSGDGRFNVLGVDFVSSHETGSTADRFFIRKDRRLVQATIALAARVAPQRIVEFGIASAGSTALLALVTEPEKLVAVERDETPVAALAELIARRGLEHVVRPHYGVDQGDRARLKAIIDDELGDARIDLVIDDASHRLLETRASFEVLFPRMRAGGVYVIEDWNWQMSLTYSIATAATRAPATSVVDDPGHAKLVEYIRENRSETPLETLALELVLARACSGDLVAEVRVDEKWVEVTRGPLPMDDSAEMRLNNLYTDPHGLLKS